MALWLMRNLQIFCFITWSVFENMEIMDWLLTTKWSSPHFVTYWKKRTPLKIEASSSIIFPHSSLLDNLENGYPIIFSYPNYPLNYLKWLCLNIILLYLSGCLFRSICRYPYVCHYYSANALYRLMFCILFHLTF